MADKKALRKGYLKKAYATDQTANGLQRNPIKGSCWNMPIALAWADRWFEDEGRPDHLGAPDLAKYIQGAINEALAAARY